MLSYFVMPIKLCFCFCFVLFFVEHTPFHFIKVSLPVPSSRPCTSPKSICSWTSSCAGTAHTENNATDTSKRSHIWTEVAGSMCLGPRNSTAHQGRKQGRTPYLEIILPLCKMNNKVFSIIRNCESLRSSCHRVCRWIF